MQTNKWGPPGWTFLHYTTFGYPETPSKDEIQGYKAFYTGLKYALPCGICRKSFGLFLETIPIDDYLADRHGVVFWFWAVHNLVNCKNHKAVQPSLEEVVHFYFGQRAQGCGNPDATDPDERNRVHQCQIDEAKKVTKEEVDQFVRDANQKYADKFAKQAAQWIQEYKCIKHFGS